MKSALLCVLLIISTTFARCPATRDFHANGDLDYYYEKGGGLSDFETSLHFVYSPEFVKKFECLDGEFDFYIKSGYFLGEYEIAILSLIYSPELYLEAKQDLFNNTNYISEQPTYVYNGFEFYKKESKSFEDFVFYINAFHDGKNTIVILGFHTNPRANINANVPEDEWPEFLRTYFGEYYDFDA